MRYTNADALSVKIASSDDGGKQCIPGISANVITVKIASRLMYMALSLPETA
ncbi:hypothetical protein C2845_PM11G05450 [Panicum miliaceum]|uniref:Uncharacterized protein n=1 Tax=Panicum miliaceum TaxID=4540 RepID=A0A3L6RUI3_PANMI|nr:hypothetical protein C2845_PM11G05450 [Panicum miliaceum]